MVDKHWTTWFISDTHFGHKNVIDFCNRPFKDEIQMKDAIIDNINKLVKKEDLLIWLGDCFFYHSVDQMKETLDRINCNRNILVKGNHDKDHRHMMNAGFEICVEQMVMKIAGEYVLLSHYPYRMDWKLMAYLKIKKKVQKLLGLEQVKLEKYHSRRPVDRGQFLIHGHTHDKEKVNKRAIHVGVDAWKFKPVNIQEISNLIAEIKKAEGKK